MLVQRERELAEMPNAVGGELVLLLLPIEFEEARDLAHRSTLEAVADRPIRPEISAGSGARPFPRADWSRLDYSAATGIRAISISRSARRYSTGITLTNLVR